MATVAIMGMVVTLSAFFLASDAASNSYAIDDPNAVMVDDQHYVSLSISNADLSFTPADGSLADSKQVDVTVSTNVPGGAKLYLSTADDTNALYKDGDTSSSSPAIQPTNGVTTLANMPVNTWGYSLDNTNFQAVPTSDSATLIANVDGSTVGTTSGDVISATVPVYYGAKVDSSLPAGTYSNKIVYSLIGTIPVNISSVAVSVGGENVENLQVGETNTIVVTTDLMTSELGTPRVYLTTTNPAGTVECGNVNVAKNSQGYMTITCVATPSAAATGVTLHITQGSSGDWKWGDFTVTLPDITPTPKPLMELTYMQEMTTKGCAASNIGDTKQLIDQRDKKQYWVAKLADGNCWMTQNLDLDLTAGVELTPDTSDVSAPWDPGATTFTSVSEGSGSSSNPTLVESWNLGEWVKTDPDAHNNRYASSNQGYAGFSQYFTDVSGMTPMTKAINEGKTPAENISVQDGQYDAHFLVGNHYSLQAATAGSAPSGSGNAPDSICPAGWQLPRRSSNGTIYNYEDLLEQYGIGNGSGQNPNGELNTAPLYFVRNGYVSPSEHYLNRAGNYGYYWYGRAYNSSRGYLLTFNFTNVDPTDNGWIRCIGASVRCIAPSA